MSRAVLVDTTICTGCRGCQVACKEENDNPAEETTFFAHAGGFQNPPALSPKTFSLVTFWELEGERREPNRIFVRRQCMHCLDPACVENCPEGALKRGPHGGVIHDPELCVGCLTCQDVCPFGVPTFEFIDDVAYLRKCEFCEERVSDPSMPAVLNQGLATEDVLDEAKRQRHTAARSTPACVAACPTRALKHGDRDELLAEAHRRIARQPGRYVDHVYGETEAGGTSWLYLAAVPFDQIGLPTDLPARAPAPAPVAAMSVLAAPQMAGVGALVGGLYWVSQRRAAVAAAAADAAPDDG